jgi:hypothetical protein
MSLERLKAVRDEVVRGEIGLHLEVTQKLLAAIDEHLKEAKADVKHEAEVVLNDVGEAAGKAFENRQ